MARGAVRRTRQSTDARPRREAVLGPHRQGKPVFPLSALSFTNKRANPAADSLLLSLSLSPSRVALHKTSFSFSLVFLFFLVFFFPSGPSRKDHALYEMFRPLLRMTLFFSLLCSLGSFAFPLLSPPLYVLLLSRFRLALYIAIQDGFPFDLFCDLCTGSSGTPD